MRVVQRLKRRLFSQTKLARLLLGLVLIILVVAGFLFSGILKRASAPTFVLLWRVQNPHEITLHTPQGKHSLDPALIVPSLNLPLSRVLAIGNTRQPPTGGLILAKSAVAELTDLPVNYIIIIPAGDTVFPQTDLPQDKWQILFIALKSRLPFRLLQTLLPPI